MILQGRNVNELYPQGVNLICNIGELSQTRNGDALVAPTPVLSVYERPMERVLFDYGRRANPFFHLFESLWMLAGGDEVAPLLNYVSNFDQFAEGDGHLHGAYGARWRWKLGRDQLNEAIRLLETNPETRQVVISMWQQDCDLGAQKKDIPCNTQIYLRVHGGRLDLTVTCRSNDVIWGAYGANAVHFSMLQEYIASRLGVLVGKLYQFSNNYHAYIPVLNKVGTPQDSWETNHYLSNAVKPRPIGEDWRGDNWDNDLAYFMAWHSFLWSIEKPPILPPKAMAYKNSWFWEVASQMSLAMYFHRKRDDGQARLHAAEIKATDWRMAAMQWLNNTTTV